MWKQRNWRRLASTSLSLAIVFVLAIAAMGLNSQDAMTSVSKYKEMLTKHERIPGEFVVRLNGSKSVGTLNSVFSKSIGVQSFKVFETSNEFVRVKIADDTKAEEFLKRIHEDPAVKYAEPNYVLKIVSGGENPPELEPNDPEFAKLWGLKNVGQADDAGQVGTAGADISATEAWAIAQGSRDLIVAVIDTGVDYNHNDLAANIAYNQGEMGDGKESNGIDDDGNGFIDDYKGWNFAGVSTNDPMDDHGHGTHCAGTIGAVGDDGNGIAGVAWRVGIVPIKFLSASGGGSLADAVSSIQYATTRGVDIMSNSWGGGGFSQAMFDAITAAKDAGILFIAAAGNDGTDADSNPHYPAGYQVDNVIAVAATDNRDAITSWSTYGKRTVHLAAPGNKIYSTIPNNQYATFSGTSMATPHVSGAAALVWSHHRGEDFTQIKERIVNSRDWRPNLARKVASSGRLNVYNAIMGIYPPNPEPAEEDWVDGAPLTDPVESAHPYLNDQDQSWTIQGPANAKHMRLVFSRVELETRYDFLRIIDANGNEVDAISGNHANGVSTWYVDGNSVTIRFTSDSSVTKWGFQLEKYQVITE